MQIHTRKTVMNKSTYKFKISPKELLEFFIERGGLTIPLISKELDLSMPTTNKLISYLYEKKYIINAGKGEKNEGRPPSLYTVNNELGFFMGVDIKKDFIHISIMDFGGNIKKNKTYKYILENSPKGLKDLCNLINDTFKEWGTNKILLKYICINIPGRIHSEEGMSHTYFSFLEDPITEVLEYELNHKIVIENDTRAMFLGELFLEKYKEKNIVFINVGWGLGSALLVNGEIVRGKDGYAGELGHFYAYDNEVLCHCGKKGCLETEVSGSALYRKLLMSLKNGKSSILSPKFNNNEKITLLDIIEATNSEDLLCIDIVEHIGSELGKRVANLINLLNPELIIIGGSLAATGDYFFLPLKSSVKKYTLKIVNKNTSIVLSKLNEYSGSIGACYIARENFIRQMVI